MQLKINQNYTWRQKIFRPTWQAMIFYLENFSQKKKNALPMCEINFNTGMKTEKKLFIN
jgi:hypothetical protein